MTRDGLPRASSARSSGSADCAANCPTSSPTTPPISDFSQEVEIVFRNKKILVALLGQIVDHLVRQVDKKQIDAILDIAEDAIEKSPTKIDDVSLGKAIGYAREMLDIPDDLDGDSD
jgi:hypothetical protein